MTPDADKPGVVSDTTTRLADERTRLAAERTRLGYERTLLAWTRTAIALITFGFATHQIFRMVRGAANLKKGLLGPREFGLAMVSIGLISLLLAVLQNRKEMRALRAQYPHLPGSSSRILAALIAILGLIAVATMLIRQ